MLLVLELGACVVLLLIIILVYHHDDGPAGKVAHVILVPLFMAAVLAVTWGTVIGLGYLAWLAGLFA